MKGRTYPEAKEGEWFTVPLRHFRLQCCDCGLVHEMNFRKKGRFLQMQVRRDERATSQVRRHKKKKGKQ